MTHNLNLVHAPLCAAFAALAVSPSVQALGENDKSWCSGEAWYNSAFGSRHYDTHQGRFVHVNNILPLYRENNPGEGVTCYQKDGRGSYSFGWYPNSKSHVTDLIPKRTDYMALGYEYLRWQPGPTTYAAGLFVGLMTGYPKLAIEELGLTIVPGLSFSVRGQKLGFEAKVVTDLKKMTGGRGDKSAIVAMSWMMKF